MGAPEEEMGSRKRPLGRGTWGWQWRRRLRRWCLEGEFSPAGAAAVVVADLVAEVQLGEEGGLVKSPAGTR
jgi:hypothetical protein